MQSHIEKTTGTKKKALDIMVTPIYHTWHLDLSLGGHEYWLLIGHRCLWVWTILSLQNSYIGTFTLCITASEYRAFGDNQG